MWHSVAGFTYPDISKDPYSSKMSEEPNLMTQHHIPEDLNPQKCYCGNLYLTNFRLTAKLQKFHQTININILLSLTLSHCVQQLYFARLCPTDRDRNIQGDTKKRELLKNPTKIEEIQEKNFNFCWVFQKLPFFCVTLCIKMHNLQNLRIL